MARARPRRGAAASCSDQRQPCCLPVRKRQQAPSYIHVLIYPRVYHTLRWRDGTFAWEALLVHAKPTFRGTSARRVCAELPPLRMRATNAATARHRESATLGSARRIRGRFACQSANNHEPICISLVRPKVGRLATAAGLRVETRAFSSLILVLETGTDV